MSVMVGVAIKDSAVWLPRFLEQLEKLPFGFHVS